MNTNFKFYRQIKVNLVFGEKRRVRLESKMPRVKVLSSAERKARRQSGDKDNSMCGSDH